MCPSSLSGTAPKCKICKPRPYASGEWRNSMICECEMFRPKLGSQNLALVWISFHHPKWDWIKMPWEFNPPPVKLSSVCVWLFPRWRKPEKNIVQPQGKQLQHAEGNFSTREFFENIGQSSRTVLTTYPKIRPPAKVSSNQKQGLGLFYYYYCGEWGMGHVDSNSRRGNTTDTHWLGPGSEGWGHWQQFPANKSS